MNETLIKRKVENVFVTEGVPQFTFVEPPNFNDILVDIRKSGKPVIVEGQSGTGKTTCIKKIIEKLKQELITVYLSARSTVDVAKIKDVLAKPDTSTYVIDDFHRLEDSIQKSLADMAKSSAEQDTGQTLPKLVLIGINQLGSDLIQMVPDVAKRMAIHQISPGTKKDIFQLINAGSAELQIEIENGDSIYEESKGDYWLSQQLCQQICLMNDVLETVDKPQKLGFDLKYLREKTVAKLKASYYPAVKDFCRGQRFRPSNDPYYKLLRSVSQQENSLVDLNELANANSDIRGSINNIKERRLDLLLTSKPACARYFYYNQETKNFAIEDPAMAYFLKHLDWDALRKDCGFRESVKDYEYDFAISFAGENRDLARHISDQLETVDVHVFYDENFEANFLGKTWSKEFERIFARDSRLVICLLDKLHKEKLWPTFERSCFQPRVSLAEVIPVYLDSTIFVEIPKDLIGIKFNWDPQNPDWQKKANDEIILKLIDRLE